MVNAPDRVTRRARQATTVPHMTISSEHAIRRSSVDGVALTEYSAGTAFQPQPLVFVHGGLHGAWSWAGWQRWFAEHGWSSTSFDWYSHGQSRQLPTDEWIRRGIADVGEEIAITCRTAGGRPILVAHSMGGLAALLYAVEHPDALSALVLLTPIVPGQFASAALEMPIEMDQPWPVPPIEMTRALFFSGVDDATAEEIYSKLQAESPKAVFEATRFVTEVDTEQLIIPTFVVAAEADQLVPANYVTALATAIDAETVVLPGAGHGVPHDRGWEKVAQQIERWLTTTVEGASAN
jgi:pimeloyl-ACP methyl ester carboxylesterase